MTSAGTPRMICQGMPLFLSRGGGILSQLIIQHTQPWVRSRLQYRQIIPLLPGGYMYLDLNYTDLTNISRTVQLMSGGYNLTGNNMAHKDVCLHGWLACRQLSCTLLIIGLSGTRCQGDKDTSQNYQLPSGFFLH